MAHYMDQIKTLAAAAGFSANPAEMVPLRIIENDIESYSAKNQLKHQVDKFLDNILEKKKLELNAEREISEKFPETAQLEIKKFREKNMILVQYLSILQTDEFKPNKFIRMLQSGELDYYETLKTFVEKARAVELDVIKLQELQAKCDELRQRTIQ